MDTRSFSFGPFVLIPQQQVLLRHNAPVPLGIRALDLLTHLVQRAGEIIDKRELMSLVWANTFVDESNLKVTIAAIRRAIDTNGTDRSHIGTVIGRGYRFVTPVKKNRLAVPATPRAERCTLPDMHHDLIGRDEVVSRLVDQMTTHRLITIVGAPGVGKTAVAIAAAKKIFERDRCRICFADLARVNPHHDGVTAVSDALGLATDIRDPIRTMTASLEHEDLLLVLDGCEAHIDAIAALSEMLLASCPQVRLLITSRQPLGLSEERMIRLPVLPAPPRHATLTTAELQRYPAIQLFLVRSSDTWDNASEADVHAMASSICGHLEGIPLAIEFAASMVRCLGFAGASLVMTDEFLHFHAGLRNRPEHHRTLAASLDRSFNLLSESERLVLSRLSRLAGNFDLDTAVFTASAGVMRRSEAIACIAALVSKSLLQKSEPESGGFRILDCLRLYARKKLAGTAQLSSRYDPIDISERRQLSAKNHHEKALLPMPTGT